MTHGIHLIRNVFASYFGRLRAPRNQAVARSVKAANCEKQSCPWCSSNSEQSKTTAIPSLPDVCGKCHGAHGPAKFRVRVNIYLLEDLPFAAFFFDLCENCMAQESLIADTQAITTCSCSYEAV